MEKKFSKEIMRILQGKYLSYIGNKGLQVLQITFSTFVLTEINYERKVF